MTIDEAIEILTKESKDFRPLGDPGLVDACKLGIEALKWRKQIEEEDPDITLEPLPGETDD